jgi:hypothetical protein
MFRRIVARRITQGRAISAAALLWTAACIVTAQTTPRAGQKAEEAYKNIKALRGTPAEDFNQTMHLMSGALGVDCEYCHVSQKDRVSDGVKAKVVARNMVKMTADLNRKSFNGQQVVTCYTCHRGNPIPPGAPVLPQPGEPADATRAPEIGDPASVRAQIEAAVKAANRTLAVHQRGAAWRLWPDADFPRTHTFKVQRDRVRVWAVTDEPLPVREEGSAASRRVG